jgi:mono/diheme cytochrome c family protein
MEVSTFFDDGQSSRQLVPGTVARGQLTSNDMRYGGVRQGPTPDAFPFEITKADLKRGQQRFEIYCGVCHGAAGDGDGMIVRRGFVKPPSLHEQRLKDAPVGHFYDVMTNGWGAMYSYNDRVMPEDRWRIAAYIRVLQLAQNDAVASAAGAGTGTGTATPANQGTRAVEETVKKITGDAPADGSQQKNSPGAGTDRPQPPQPGATQ